MFALIKKHRFVIFSLVFVLTLVAAAEFFLGRTFLGPDGQFGWWSNDIYSITNSQRVADVYSLSHIIHGILFFAFLWLVACRLTTRCLPVKYRFLIAMLIEAGWEILENSAVIINRYREATIALGYTGDSVLNSLADVGMAALGFLIAFLSVRFSKIWLSIALIIIFELGTLWWVRDNLTLNVLMLVHPLESVRTWQSEGY
ncbi:MAG: DUF2585 family protein [Patescibacteria group bacterium]